MYKIFIYCQKQGEFYSITHPVEAPCNAPDIPPASTVDGTAMMYLWVSTLVPNSAGFVYQEAGILTYNITPNSSFVSTKCSYMLLLLLSIESLDSFTNILNNRFLWCLYPTGMNVYSSATGT